MRLEAYVAVVAVSAAATFVATFGARPLARRLGAMAIPDHRRLHPGPIPRLGGVGLYAGFIAAMAFALGRTEFHAAFAGSSLPLGVVVAATIMFGLGFVDDVRELAPPPHAAGQVLAGSVLSLFGAGLFFFRIPFGEVLVISPDLQPLLTVLWVVAIATAVNWIDGLDGLAAGVLGIAAGAFLLYSHHLMEAGILPEDRVLAPLLAAIVLGCCIGFLPHNFQPARIHMAGGVELLGLLLAASTILVGGGTAAEFSGQTYFFFAPIVIPFVILGIPVLDVLQSVVRRAARGLSPAAGDRGHLHYRLLELGHGYRRAVLILWVWTAILSGIVLFPIYTGEGDAIVPLVLAGCAVLLYTLFHPEVVTKRRQVAGNRADVQREVPQPESGAA